MKSLSKEHGEQTYEIHLWSICARCKRNGHLGHQRLQCPRLEPLVVYKGQLRFHQEQIGYSSEFFCASNKYV